MKKKILSLLSLAMMFSFAMTTLTLTSCSNDDGTQNPPPKPDEPAEGSYTIKKETKGEQFTSIVVEYASLSQDKKTRQNISGVITIPNGMILGTVLDNHYTISSNEEAPSLMGTTDFGANIGAQFCVVATDYIGFGLTKDQRQTYLAHEICAQNSIDLAVVAQDILKKRGLNGGKLFNLGYSQGGAVALAVHRAMEKDADLAKRLNFVGSWCGDGPYDVVATVRHYLDNPENVTYPVGLPLLVEGFLAAAPENLKGDLKFADFFTDKMNKAGLEGWLKSRQYNTGEINEKIQAVVGDAKLTLNDIFSPGMASLDGSLMKKYMEYAKQNDIITGWKPEKFPLMLIHNSSDEIVPVVNAQNAKRALGLTDDACMIVTMDLSHGDFGPVYYATALASILTNLE